MTDTTTKDLVKEARADADWLQSQGVLTPQVKLLRELADTIERLTASAPVERSELHARVLGVLDDYRMREPEPDESWESWFHAAFDLAINKIDTLLAASLPASAPARGGETCAHCNGSGDDQNNLNDPGPCHHCDGTGTITAAPRTAQVETEVVLRLAFEHSPTGLWFCLSHEDPKIFIANENLGAIVDDLPNVLRRVFSLPALSPQAGVSKMEVAERALIIVQQMIDAGLLTDPSGGAVEQFKSERDGPASKEAAE